jgi:hypothetical protein
MPNHVIQDTMYITNVFYGTICYLLGWHLFIIGLDLNIVILDKATLCLRHYVSDIYLYHYIHCKVIQ